MSLPSSGLSAGFGLAPARASTVGMTSTMCSVSLTTRGLSLAGQLKMVGTRTPPSYRLPLPPRRSPLLAGKDSCLTPLSARSSFECAPLATTALRGPPLSLEKMSSVFSRKPALVQRGDDSARPGRRPK